MIDLAGRRPAWAESATIMFSERTPTVMSDSGAPNSNRMLDLASDVDTLVIGTSPAQSFAMLDAVMTQAVGMAMFNAVHAQQTAAITRNAAVTMACTVILSTVDAGSAQDAAQSSAASPGNDETATRPAPARSEPDTLMTNAATARNETASSDASAATADRSAVDPQIIDAINQIQKAVLSPQVIVTGGAGKAYQAVAQSALIAIQDAADALRGVSTIAATSSAVALTRFLSTGDPKYLLGVTAARDMVTAATDDLARVGAVAGALVGSFPSGSLPAPSTT